MLDETAFAGSETNVLFFSQPAYRELIRAALFDTTIAGRLPDVKVRYFYGAGTPGIFVLATWDVSQASPSYYGGVAAREIKLQYGDEGNYFLSYDNPERSL
ncbi:hypothetical protein BDN72DRAFT_831807 [Pluteus cervinus]|uniref:Uncharacterized protein n=1 Tax=Pluteus cervinus TaxID=181527 RepID=A0ACD3BCV2_9AGAR|nr:hypothetical protein BDN72DRAFT_831807 [Pluteus cervinus]